MESKVRNVENTLEIRPLTAGELDHVNGGYIVAALGAGIAAAGVFWLTAGVIADWDAPLPAGTPTTLDGLYSSW
jgi:hypothetical protein